MIETVIEDTKIELFLPYEKTPIERQQELIGVCYALLSELAAPDAYSRDCLQRSQAYFEKG